MAQHLLLKKHSCAFFFILSNDNTGGAQRAFDRSLHVENYVWLAGWAGGATIDRISNSVQVQQSFPAYAGLYSNKLSRHYLARSLRSVKRVCFMLFLYFLFALHTSTALHSVANT